MIKAKLRGRNYTKIRKSRKSEQMNGNKKEYNPEIMTIDQGKYDTQ